MKSKLTKPPNFEDQWVELYGEMIKKSKAAKVIGMSPAFISCRLLDGTLTDYGIGVSVRELARFVESGRRAK